MTHMAHHGKTILSLGCRASLGHVPDMSDTLVERLRQAIAASGQTPRSISLRAGLSESAVKHILRGNSRSPRLETINKLANSLNIPANELTGSSGAGATSLIATLKGAENAAAIPVYGVHSLGADGRFHLNRTALTRVLAPRPVLGWPGAFALYAPDDAMAPRWKAGDLVLAQPDKPPRDGDHVLAQLAPVRGQPVYAFRQLLRRERGQVLLGAYHAGVPQLTVPLLELIRVVDWPELLN
jgi:transcriptional regulator with XRE-family HTH domain